MQAWYHCENVYPFVPHDVLDRASSVRGSLPNRYCDPQIAADLFHECLGNRVDARRYIQHPRLMTDILSDLAKLSPQQRLELIEWLWDSLQDKDIPVTAAQCAELERRLASFDQDREHGVTWEVLRSELWQRR